MSVALVFLAWLLFSVVPVLIGWLLPVPWYLASLLHVSLLPVFPSRLISGSWSLASLPPASLLPVFPVRLLDLSPVLLLPWLSVCCFLVLDALRVCPGGYMS